jgi:hypothetical protein
MVLKPITSQQIHAKEVRSEGSEWGRKGEKENQCPTKISGWEPQAKYERIKEMRGR